MNEEEKPQPTDNIYRNMRDVSQSRHRVRNQHRNYSSQASSSKTSNIDKNAITLLQELCSRLRWMGPVYIEVGFTHPMFTFECRVKNVREIGQGNSKKAAKLAAAENVWRKIGTKHS